MTKKLFSNDSVSKIKVVKSICDNEKENGCKFAKRKRQNKTKGRQSTKTTYQKESWYCVVCHEDRKIDMRQCIVYKVWVHEKCVGLGPDDDEQFICPNCSH